ncbi:ATP cone domain-containing protein [Sphingobacterium paludis]|uniref:Holliday junction resolvase n=1 Tax=Sphingobacterium paludis TaxID=1476465 RepID=A0A4R7DCS3_9SPHI|nr:ATP cone domain-containing protein [Sphingobacterium paludis]TDS17734.1 Holliday junction resolvase [Sphingobacterium paludis]
MQVKKYSGELVPFDPHSLRQSLFRSGATEAQVEQVYQAIQAKLYDGISTRELYDMAFDSLKEHKGAHAARYALKKALQELGPEGFYFERWIAKLFADDGYQTMTSQTIKGRAITHEIDVIALQGDELLAIECKFRNDADAKISVTTPMYFLSRVNDIKGLPYNFFGSEKKLSDGWLVTNAHLTLDSKTFGSYYKLNLLAWDYPAEKNIKQRVDNKGLYPITCLSTLSTMDKATLLKNECILVQDLIHMPKFLDHLQADGGKRKRILQEATELLHTPVEMV